MNEVLIEELRKAQIRGWIGPALTDQIRHSLAFGEAAAVLASDTVVDLGSGGGLPALVLALAQPEAQFHLVEAQLDRAHFLLSSVEVLNLADRVTVHHCRAEDFGHGQLRGAATVVTARSFGPPALVAENGAPLLALGGRLVVSEPPTMDNRWPVDGIDALGLGPPQYVSRSQARFVVLESDGTCERRYPRRTKPQRANPLF